MKMQRGRTSYTSREQQYSQSLVNLHRYNRYGRVDSPMTETVTTKASDSQRMKLIRHCGTCCLVGT